MKSGRFKVRCDRTSVTFIVDIKSLKRRLPDDGDNCERWHPKYDMQSMAGQEEVRPLGASIAPPPELVEKGIFWQGEQSASTTLPPSTPLPTPTLLNSWKVRGLQITQQEGATG